MRVIGCFVTYPVSLNNVPLLRMKNGEIGKIKETGEFSRKRKTSYSLNSVKFLIPILVSTNQNLILK